MRLRVQKLYLPVNAFETQSLNHSPPLHDTGFVQILMAMSNRFGKHSLIYLITRLSIYWLKKRQSFIENIVKIFRDAHNFFGRRAISNQVKKRMKSSCPEFFMQ